MLRPSAGSLCHGSSSSVPPISAWRRRAMVVQCAWPPRTKHQRHHHHHYHRTPLRPLKVDDGYKILLWHANMWSSLVSSCVCVASGPVCFEVSIMISSLVAACHTPQQAPQPLQAPAAVQTWDNNTLPHHQNSSKSPAMPASHSCNYSVRKGPSYIVSYAHGGENLQTFCGI